MVIPQLRMRGFSADDETMTLGNQPEENLPSQGRFPGHNQIEHLATVCFVRIGVRAPQRENGVQNASRRRLTFEMEVAFDQGD